MTYGSYMGTQLPAMFRIGNASKSGSYTAFDVNETAWPLIPLVNPNTLRHGNFDYVSSSVVWSPAVANHDLPVSLYLVDKPAFFGSEVWPWVDPVGATKAAVLPAQKRYVSMQ